MPQAAPAMFALAAVQAVSQIQQGYAQNAEAKANASMVSSTANYNASLLENKGKVIDLQKSISNDQYNRTRGQYASRSTVTAAAGGYAMNGSAAAVMLDTQTQINIDNAITNFNYDQEKLYNTNAAKETLRQGQVDSDTLRRKGKQAVSSGYSNAFSSILTGAVNYAMYSGMGAKDKTFDSVVKKSPRQGISWSDT